MKDRRILVIELAKGVHSLRSAGVKYGRNEAHWSCRCGLKFTGDDAIANGRLHDIEVILAALDADAEVTA